MPLCERIPLLFECRLKLIYYTNIVCSVKNSALQVIAT